MKKARDPSMTLTANLLPCPLCGKNPRHDKAYKTYKDGRYFIGEVSSIECDCGIEFALLRDRIWDKRMNSNNLLEKNKKDAQRLDTKCRRRWNRRKHV